MKIFGWAADNAGPGFYRLRVPLDALARHGGHEVRVDTRMDEWGLEEADVIVGQRVAQPGAAKRWERLATNAYGRRPLLVLELDDDLWNVDPANVPAWKFFREGGPGILDNLTRSVKLADVVTVSTEPLAEVVRRINPNVVVLPNSLPAAAYLGGGRRADGLRIGWGGGASHVLDVEEMLPSLRQHLRRRPRDTYVNMGTLFPSVTRAVSGAGRVQAFPWTDDMDQYYRQVASLDIGLAPLRPSVFNRSKSDLKVLEYAAAGVAFIASKVGPYESSVDDGATGLLTTRPHEWGVALRYLSENDAARTDLAADAYTWALSRSVDQTWQHWETVYGSV